MSASYRQISTIYEVKKIVSCRIVAVVEEICCRMVTARNTIVAGRLMKYEKKHS